MIAALKSFFAELSQQDQQKIVDLPLAVAVLLMEVANADMHISEDEKIKVGQMLVKGFELDNLRASALVEQAIELQHDSVSVQTYTRVLSEKLIYADRVRFVRAMWLLAYVDQQLDPYEDHIIRKISDLLYLKHCDFIQTKLQAQHTTNSMS
ncbi:TerB family tellurite resistance protein [Motilimonas eburnea]|uniref:tellurite resistance TerB family protein n=1 Tax=Motilimonas eburnea TaxID=1737488 RepID=UPI001E587AB0|nr:TerB family tellurite resistance protein [Motilimonas eburnea]MCE2570499.1 TerB family tellurite resistance protein [Motilimonas eburnea]